MYIHVKRVYDPPARSDGLRVLVDQLWPRGLKKADAAVDVWAKNIAPSKELRKWFNHEVEKFSEFARRYRLELQKVSAEIEKLINTAGGTMTLLYAAANTKSNHAVVLQQWLYHRGQALGIPCPTTRTLHLQ